MFNYLNNIHNCIKLKIDVKQNKPIALLDVKILKKEQTRIWYPQQQN